MIKILVKNRLRSLIGTVLGKSKNGEVKKASKLKILGFSLLYAYVIGFFLFFSSTIAVMLGKTLISIGASWLYFAFFMLITLFISFIFSIFETKSELYECKDNNLLLSMPIKPRDIVASRIAVVLIYNYIEELIVMLPCIVVYAIYSHDAVGVVGALIVSVFLPLIPTSLASGVGYLVALISRRVKKNSFITVAISLLFLAVYFIGYEYLMLNFNAYIEKLSQSGFVPASEMPFMYHLGASCLMKPLNLLIIIALSLVIGALTYYIISRSYIKIVTDNYSVKKAEYKGGYIKSKSVLRALTEKELKRFFSSSAYMLNSALGLVFLVAAGIIAAVKRESMGMLFSLVLPEFGISAVGASAIMIMAIVCLSSLNTMSASALSLEGKCIWIPKTMPIRDRDLLFSKVLPQIIIVTPPTLLTSVLFIIATSAPMEYWIFYVLTPLFANVFSAMFGLVINVAFPKFDFENDLHVIKQSLSVFIVMFGQMIFAFGLTAVCFLLLRVLSPLLVTALYTILFATLSALMYAVLVGPVKKKYSEICL